MNLDEYEASVAAACLNPESSFPANHFAFRHVLSAIGEPAGQSLVEIGVGGGGAIPLFAGLGVAFAGVDKDADCVERSRAALAEAGQDPQRILLADLEDPESYALLPGAGSFDVLVAMGVLPHVSSVEQALLNAVSLVRPGGHIFVEFRNALFSLVTFNRYTQAFICDDLLSDVSPQTRAAVDEELARRLNLAVPPGVIHPEVFHVPFAIVDTARRIGLKSPRAIPFHFHAGMPVIEGVVPESYRHDSVALEDDSSDWKGLFLASAFLLHAQRAS